MSDKCCNGINCETTKRLFDNIESVKHLINSVISQNTLLSDLVKAQQQTIESLSEQQTQTQVSISTVANDMKKMMAHLDIEDCEPDCEPDDLDDPSGILLLGDCLVRDIESTSEELTVINLGEAKFCNTRKYLKSLKSKKKKFKEIVVACGTNDAATNMSEDRIIQECEAVLLLAKEMAATCRHRYRLKCYQCHGEGHKRKFCPQMSRENNWQGYA
jgi:uncharacterized coiled-coil protein SlyX